MTEVTWDTHYVANGTRSTFVGKIAALGQGGSGKTYMTNQLANHLAKQEVFSWREEEQMAGTIGVTPYSIDFPDGRRVIINDNPGQNSLELVRQAIASQGNVYQGLLLVADGVGWNFRDIGIYHAEPILKNMGPEAPVAVIITKKDLRDYIISTGKLEEMAEVLARAVHSVHDGMVVPYRDRAFRRDGSFKLRLPDTNFVPLTAMEQVLVNALDEWLRMMLIPGFTPMNVRLMVRSLLLGFCEFMLSVAPDIASLYPQFNAIDPDLVNRLNYHRPTAFETGTGWLKLAGQDRDSNPLKHEPPIICSFFDEQAIRIVLREFVMTDDRRVSEYIQEVKNKGWNVVTHAYTDSVSLNGRDKVATTVQNLMDAMTVEDSAPKLKQSAKVENELSLQALGLDDF